MASKSEASFSSVRLPGGAAKSGKVIGRDRWPREGGLGTASDRTVGYGDGGLGPEGKEENGGVGWPLDLDLTESGGVL